MMRFQIEDTELDRELYRFVDHDTLFDMQVSKRLLMKSLKKSSEVTLDISLEGVLTIKTPEGVSEVPLRRVLQTDALQIQLNTKIFEEVEEHVTVLYKAVLQETGEPFIFAMTSAWGVLLLAIQQGNDI